LLSDWIPAISRFQIVVNLNIELLRLLHQKQLIDLTLEFVRHDFVKLLLERRTRQSPLLSHLFFRADTGLLKIARG